MDTSENLKCQFCSKNDSKYTCPRCNSPYCTLDCYRSERHQKCSESFYKDCVFEALKNEENDDQSKSKIIDILKRHHDNENTEIEDSLIDSLQNLDLDSVKADELWNYLSEAEKKEFKSLIKTGGIGNLIPDFHPWWHKEVNLISEVGESSSDNSLIRVPDICNHITKFSQLTKVKPSDCIPFNLLNALYGYVYVLIYKHGHFQEEPVSFVFMILNISNNLRNGENFKSVDHAIASTKYQLTGKTDMFVSQSFSANIIQELEKIVKGPSHGNKSQFVLAALSDMLSMFKKCEKEMKSQSVIVKKLKLMRMKIKYFLSWVIEFGDCLQQSLTSLELEYISMTQENFVQSKLLENADEIKKNVSERLTLLIQEIS